MGHGSEGHAVGPRRGKRDREGRQAGQRQGPRQEGRPRPAGRGLRAAHHRARAARDRHRGQRPRRGREGRRVHDRRIRAAARRGQAAGRVQGAEAMSRDNGRALVVPIDVAALCVTDSDRHTVEFADLAAHFDDLPYFDAAWGYANDRNLPNFAEHVLPKPFDAAAPYESGVHLHWALPDALRHGVSDGTGPMRFPTAPDRWLVMRLESAAAPEASWIIESDHLWDQGDELDDGRVNNDRLLQNAFSRALPLAPFPARTTGKPFCAMGRVFPYVPGRRDAGPSCTLTTTAEKGARTLMVSDASGWGIAGNSVAVIHDGDNTEIVFVKEPPATNAKTLTLVVPTASRHGEDCVVDGYRGDRFTALGYGTTAFAAAYPHCPNVFGFWDPVGIDQADLSYLVAGWYSQRRRDCLQKAKFSESTRPELKGRFAADNMAWAVRGS